MFKLTNFSYKRPHCHIISWFWWNSVRIVWGDFRRFDPRLFLVSFGFFLGFHLNSLSFNSFRSVSGCSSFRTAVAFFSSRSLYVSLCLSLARRRWFPSLEVGRTLDGGESRFLPALCRGRDRATDKHAGLFYASNALFFPRSLAATSLLYASCVVLLCLAFAAFYSLLFFDRPPGKFVSFSLLSLSCVKIEFLYVSFIKVPHLRSLFVDIYPGMSSFFFIELWFCRFCRLFDFAQFCYCL